MLRLSLLLTLAVILLFGFLHLSQLRFLWALLNSIFCPRPKLPERAGQPYLCRNEADILLLVDTRRIVKSEHFETTSWSYAWGNFLEQESGGRYALLDWQQLTAEDCRNRRLIIVTSSASQNIPSINVLAELRRIAESGGCVLLETPQAAWRALSGGVLEEDTFNVSGGASRGRVLAYGKLPNRPGGQVLQAEMALEESPVFSFIHATKVLDAGTEGLGVIRDVPALWQRACGKGWIVTLTFDFGMHLQAMQQGAPSQGWRVRELNGAFPILVESQDLALSRDMMDNGRPYADMLEDWLAGFLDGALRLWPRWWRFPYEYDGVLALTCNVTGLERKCASPSAVAEDAAAWPLTVFGSCVTEGADHGAHASGVSCSSSPFRSIAAADSRGILWKRFVPDVPLLKQIERIDLTAQQGSFCRIYNLDWGGDYAEPFRFMAAAGIDADSSYGPNRSRGYIFGTGLPFQALDDNGCPLGVWEWPFVLRGSLSDENAAYVSALLNESLTEYHQAPVTLWQPLDDSAEADIRRHFGNLAAAARQKRHWLADFNDYWSFHQNRAQALLQSRVQNGRLEVSLRAPISGMAVLLHGSAGDIKINGRPALVRSLRFNGEHHWLVAVPRGSSRLTAESGGFQHP